METEDKRKHSKLKGCIRVKDKIVTVPVSMRKSTIAKLESYVTDARGKVLKNSVDLIIQAIEEYGNDFILDMVLGKHIGKYKIIKVG